MLKTLMDLAIGNKTDIDFSLNKGHSSVLRRIPTSSSNASASAGAYSNHVGSLGKELAWLDSQIEDTTNLL